MAGGLASRVLNMLARAVLQRVDPTTARQLLDVVVLAGENRQAVPYYEPYGFTGIALDGAKLLMGSVGGSRENLVCLSVCDDRYRPTDLVSGEVALYTDEGDRVALRRNGVLQLRAAEKVSLGIDNATDPVVRRSDLQAAVDAFNAHTHSIPAGTDSSGGTSGSGPSHTATGSEKVFAE